MLTCQELQKERITCFCLPVLCAQLYIPTLYTFLFASGVVSGAFLYSIARGLLVPKMDEHTGVQVPSSQNSVASRQLVCT